MKPLRPITQRRKAADQRRAAVAVEFALTVPILFLMVMGALELGHANMVLNTTEAACYEGARMGIVPGATAADCETATQRLLNVGKIKNATISVTPNNLAVQSNDVTIQVSVPYRNNAITVPFFTRGLTITRQCKLTREKP